MGAGIRRLKGPLDILDDPRSPLRRHDRVDASSAPNYSAIPPRPCRTPAYCGRCRGHSRTRPLRKRRPGDRRRAVVGCTRTRHRRRGGGLDLARRTCRHRPAGRPRTARNGSGPGDLAVSGCRSTNTDGHAVPGLAHSESPQRRVYRRLSDAVPGRRSMGEPLFATTAPAGVRRSILITMRNDSGRLTRRTRPDLVGGTYTPAVFGSSPVVWSIPTSRPWGRLLA
jgi:hypothetical protein